MTHATRDRRPRHTVAAGRPERPEGPPDGGGVGESRPVKEGSRGRPGRHRHKTMTGPGKEGRKYGRGIGERRTGPGNGMGGSRGEGEGVRREKEGETA